MLDIRRIPDYAEVLVEKAEENDATLCYEVQNDRVNVYLSAPMSHPKIVKLRWKAKIDSDVRVLGDAWERSYADLGFIGLTTEKAHPWHFIMKHGGGTDGIDIAVSPASFVSRVVDCEGVTAFCDVRSGSIGVELGDRELFIGSFMSESYSSDRDNCFESACDFCSKMCPDPVLPTEPVYGGNNWYYAYGKSSHEEIISDTKFVKRMTQGLANIPYMVIDDGWQPNSCDAPWVGNERFPDMKALATEMKALGVRPGIWVRYLINGRDDEPRKVDTFPEEWYTMRNSKVLDPSRPEVLEYVKKTTERLVGWGYELIKHDFSTFDIFGKWGFELKEALTVGNWHFYDRTKTSAEIVKAFYKAIKDSSNGAVIIGCNAIGHLCAGLHQLNRTGDDTSGFEWSRTQKMGINTLAFRLPQNNKFFGADADCVGIMGKIDWRLNSKWLYLLSRSASSLFVSCKPGILSEDEEKELKEAFKVASLQEDELIPLDWMETTCPQVYKINGEIVELELYEDKGTTSFNP